MSINHGVPHLDGKQHQFETSAVMYYVILTVVLFVLLLYGFKKKEKYHYGSSCSKATACKTAGKQRKPVLLAQTDGQALHQKWLHFATIEMILKRAPSRAWGQPAGWQVKTRVYARWLYARAHSGSVESEVTFC